MRVILNCWAYEEKFYCFVFTMLLVGVVVSCSDNVDFDENQSDEVLNSNISSSDLLMNLERSFYLQHVLMRR